ncbi:MAG: hypothetical protein HC831_15030 [Chloroflexia bacterium]|nr:hypothetical protein [Chloroflexia bacterium]
MKQLAVANKNVKNALVVVFANKPREEIEDAISAHSEEFGKLKIISRCGNPEDPADLKRLNIDLAKSVIVLDEDNENDSAVVSAVLAVLSISTNPEISIVAEIDNPNHASTLEHVYKGNVLCVNPTSITAQVAAQASRQPGLAAVILDFLDFEGEEIYFGFVPELKGKTYAEALLSFNDCSVFGYIDDSGKSHINPPHDTILGELDEIIVVAFDDDKIKYSSPTIDRKTIKSPEAFAVNEIPEHILIVGWSFMGLEILNELTPFLPSGSTIHIIAQEKYCDLNDLDKSQFPEIQITNSYYDGNFEDLDAIAKSKHFDAIIVLGYRDALKVEEADTQTILTMLQINRLYEEIEGEAPYTRLLSEILDSRKAALARFVSDGELVLSDNLAALVLAQLSENPGLESVYADLFVPSGAFVSLKPIERYTKLNEEIDFNHLVVKASMLGESAIGYRVLANILRNAAEGVELNPKKTKKFVPQKGDSLLVLCSQ